MIVSSRLSAITPPLAILWLGAVGLNPEGAILLDAGVPGAEPVGAEILGAAGLAAAGFAAGFAAGAVDLLSNAPASLAALYCLSAANGEELSSPSPAPGPPTGAVDLAAGAAGLGAGAAAFGVGVDAAGLGAGVAAFGAGVGAGLG